MSIQIIENNGKPEYAVVPINEYNELMGKAEMLDDIAAFDKAMKELDEGENELVPSEIVDALLSDANPLKIWRKYRGISQKKLADAAGVSQAYIGQVEKGKRNGTVNFYKAVAEALNVDIDDLV